MAGTLELGKPIKLSHPATPVPWTIWTCIDAH